MLKPTLPTDDDDEGPFYEVSRLTPYDRRFTELRALEAKRDAIKANVVLTDKHMRTLAVLSLEIEVAQRRFRLESARSLDDVWRRRRSIDEWRAEIGRDQYNCSRRKVRSSPNRDLSDMSSDQKAQYEKDMRADANWFKRRRDQKMTEPEIAAAYLKRLEDRKCKTCEAASAKEQADAEEAHLRSLPGFGDF